MQAPMNEYYTDEEYQYALKQMYRMMERNRIIAEAKIAITAKNKLKENFSKTAKKIATETNNYHKHKQPNGHCNTRKSSQES